MYMCLIAPWLKPGKLQRGMYSFMVLYNLLGGARVCVHARARACACGSNSYPEPAD